MNVKVGSVILARTYALMVGDQYELGDPTSWKNDDWNWLGENYTNCTPHIEYYDFTTVTVVAIVKFPSIVRTLNHFHVLLPDGQVARIFDDQENGSWVSPNASKRVKHDADLRWHSRKLPVAGRTIGLQNLEHLKP
jgi:hypothetical protein